MFKEDKETFDKIQKDIQICSEFIKLLSIQSKCEYQFHYGMNVILGTLFNIASSSLKPEEREGFIEQVKNGLWMNFKDHDKYCKNGEKQ